MKVPACSDCGATEWSLRETEHLTTDAAIDPVTGIPGVPRVTLGGEWSESQVSCDACGYELDTEDCEWLAPLP